MFTGIVEEVGTIKKINQLSDEAIQLTIEAKVILEELSIGDSIAVNGICLTATSFHQTAFQVDVMPETMRATSLATLQQKSIVNLERALQPTDRFGGHFVTGHIDGTGEIIRKQEYENAVYIDIQASSSLIDYFIMKGSIAVDGVSLTIFGVDHKQGTVTISLIPHTLSVTNLGEKNVGDIVNIECDMLAKHVHHYVKNMLQPDRLTEE